MTADLPAPANHGEAFPHRMTSSDDHSKLGKRNRIRPLAAVRALRALARSGGHDYREAAAFMNATEGRSGQRAFLRFANSSSGQQLLRDRPALSDVLRSNDEAHIAASPLMTLGDVYRAFMVAHDFSVEGMAELAEAGGQRPMANDEKWFTARMNTLHDVRHVVAGYGPEPLGELCLLAFRYAQARHPGMAFFAVAWTLKMARERRGDQIEKAVLEGYRRGRNSVWIDDLPWENLVQQQLGAVRTQLGLSAPLVYNCLLAREAAYASPAWTVWERDNS